MSTVLTVDILFLIFVFIQHLNHYFEERDEEEVEVEEEEERGR
jgi:hypothetical protein